MKVRPFLIYWRAASLSLLFLLMYENGQAQKTWAEYDKETYQLFVDKKWSELLETSEEAINQGHDYLNMRLRRGLAYNSLNQNLLAQEEFIRALKFDAANPIAIEAMTLINTLNGDLHSQLLLNKKLTAEQKTKLRVRDPFLIQFSADAGFQYYQSANVGRPPASSEFNETKNMTLGSFNVTHKLVSGFTLAHTLGGFAIQKNQLIQFNAPAQSSTLTYKQSQLEYHALIVGKLSPYFMLTIGGHYINLTNGQNLINFNSRPPSITENSQKTNNYATQLGFMYNRKKIVLGGYGVLSNLNAVRYQQVGALFTYFPLGNKNLYLNGSASVLIQAATTTVASSTNAIYQLGAGGKIAAYTWLDFQAYYGKHQNFLEPFTPIIFNIADQIDWRVKLGLTQHFSKFSFRLGYQLNKRSNNFVVYTPSSAFIDSNVFNTFSHLTTIGITWNL